MTTEALPQFVSAFYDRHGKRRYRYRRPTVSRYLKADFGSDEFGREVEALNAISAGTLRVATPEEAEDRRNEAERERGKITGYVYFIGAKDGPIKIGFTKDVERRLRGLQNGHPHKLAILASMPGSIAIERAFHAMFRRTRLVGEWFSRTEEMMRFITSLARENDGALSN